MVSIGCIHSNNLEAAKNTNPQISSRSYDFLSSQYTFKVILLGTAFENHFGDYTKPQLPLLVEQFGWKESGLRISQLVIF